jgi:hypothetical protein
MKNLTALELLGYFKETVPEREFNILSSFLVRTNTFIKSESIGRVEPGCVPLNTKATSQGAKEQPLYADHSRP